MIYIQANEPVSFPYTDIAAGDITSASLHDPTNTELTVTTPIATAYEDGTKQWYAIFDPNYFDADKTYSIVWSGTTVNGDLYTSTETGIQVKLSTDFYQTFIDSLRQSLFDDSQACDYPVPSLINAVKYATSYMNTQAPFTQYFAEQMPFSLLIDFSKVYLYRGKAAREAMDTFMYSDIGKSFSIDRSGKLLQLASDLNSTANQQLALFKKNVRPAMLGLHSRYSRAGRLGTYRSVLTNRIVFRDFNR